MANEELRYIGKAYLQNQRARVACELQMKKLKESRLINAGVASVEQVDEEDVEARAANKYKKTKLTILDQKKADKVIAELVERKEYQRLVKYAAALEREEKDFLYTATQVSQDSPIWDFARKVKGFGDVAVMTVYTIVDLDQIADESGVVTAGRVWKYLGLVPGQRLKSGELGGFNTTLKGRWYMVRKNLILARDPYYTQVYKIMKNLYLNRPDLIALNGSTARADCGHYVAALEELKREPAESFELSPREFLIKFRVEAAKQEIEEEIKTEMTELRKQKLAKKDTAAEKEKLQAKQDKMLEEKTKELETDLAEVSDAEISDAVNEIKIKLGYKVHCPMCKATVNVETVENRTQRPGWKKWIDEMAGRWMGKLLLSHCVEIIATAEGYHFSKHSDYIPPKPDDEISQRDVIERFRHSRENQLMRYVEAFAKHGSIQSVKDNMQSFWERKDIGTQGSRARQAAFREERVSEISSENPRSSHRGEV